jgi:mRNA interferase RelE/StbE
MKSDQSAKRYAVSLTSKTKEELRVLPTAIRREIGHRLFQLEDGLGGDVKKLKGLKSAYRLRVGDYRILFELEGRRITVYAVGQRKDIYR